MNLFLDFRADGSVGNARIIFLDVRRVLHAEIEIMLFSHSARCALIRYLLAKFIAWNNKIRPDWPRAKRNIWIGSNSHLQIHTCVAANALGIRVRVSLINSINIAQEKERNGFHSPRKQKQEARANTSKRRSRYGSVSFIFLLCSFSVRAIIDLRWPKKKCLKFRTLFCLPVCGWFNMNLIKYSLEQAARARCAPKRFMRKNINVSQHGSVHGRLPNKLVVKNFNWTVISGFQNENSFSVFMWFVKADEKTIYHRSKWFSPLRQTSSNTNWYS